MTVTIEPDIATRAQEIVRTAQRSTGSSKPWVEVQRGPARPVRWAGDPIDSGEFTPMEQAVFAIVRADNAERLARGEAEGTRQWLWEIAFYSEPSTVDALLSGACETVTAIRLAEPRR